MKITITNQIPFRNCKRQTRNIIESPKDCLMIDESELQNLQDSDTIIFNINFVQYGIREKREITKKELYDQIRDLKAFRRVNGAVKGFAINLDRNNCRLV